MFVLTYNYKQVGSTSYEKARLRFANVIAILLVLQSGLRNVSIGADTGNYMGMFYSHINWSWKDVFNNFIDVYKYGEGKDAGYVLLMKLFSVFSSNYQVFLVFVAVIVFVPLVAFVYDNTDRIEHLWLALLLYQTLFYSFLSITGIRQSIATGLCLWSVKYIKNKKVVPFLILMLMGTLIHSSCLIFLPFYWIAHFKKPRLMFVGMLCLFPILLYLGSTFALQLAIISGDDRYLLYAEQESSGAMNLIIFYFIISLAGFIRYWKDNDYMISNSHIFNAISLGIFFLPLTLNSANLVRVVQYYSIFSLVLMGSVFAPVKLYEPRFFIKTAQFVLLGAILYKLITNPMEYSFFWQGN